MMVNASFAICSIPFTNKILENFFKNRKKNRIKEARNELEKYCLQQLIMKQKINKNNFDNQLFIISKKYAINIKEIFISEYILSQNLAQSIININLFDEDFKENIIYRIRNKSLFSTADEDKIKTFPEHDTNTYNDYNEDIFNDINFIDSAREKIIKYTILISILIFLTLLIFTSLIQVLFEIWGIISVLLFNTLLMMIFTFPVLVNGIINFKKFDFHAKQNFCFLFIIILLALINFICIMSIIN